MGIMQNVKSLFNTTKTESFKMITQKGNGFYTWNGKMFESDIIRACVRPKVKAIGKLTAKHIRSDGSGIKTNPEPYMRFLLSDPNPYMSGQMLQEKLANQLILNNNAFLLIVRDEMGMPIQLYNIPACGVEAVYDNLNELYLKFYFENGNISVFPYTEIIHIRDDFNSNDLFGESPGKALMPLMNIVVTTDQGMVKAIKNSSVVRWLLKINQNIRFEDIRKEVKKFVDNYLDVESDTFGAAGIGNNMEAQRIEPKDYVPNALQIDRTSERIYSFFNTNQKIIQSSYNEDEWNSYFESVIEPVALQLSNEFTRKLFTRREVAFGNRIYFDASNLACASISTKLALQAMVDRGALTPNEWRDVFNLSPVDGGDIPIRRLDTEPTSTTGGDEDEKLGN